MIGIKSLFKSSESFYGLDLVSLTSLSCTGAGCPAACLKRSKCLQLQGNIVNNVCALCASNQYFDNGQCRCQIDEEFINNSCQCRNGFIRLGGLCVNRCGINQ
jgi:hypothetical protein